MRFTHVVVCMKSLFLSIAEYHSLAWICHTSSILHWWLRELSSVLTYRYTLSSFIFPTLLRFKLKYTHQDISEVHTFYHFDTCIYVWKYHGSWESECVHHHLVSFWVDEWMDGGEEWGRGGWMDRWTNGRQTGRSLMWHSFLLLFWMLSSLVAQTVRNPPSMQWDGFEHWVRKIPWRREWLSTPVFLPGEFHEQRSTDYSPWGHTGSDTAEQLTHTHFGCTALTIF